MKVGEGCKEGCAVDPFLCNILLLPKMSRSLQRFEPRLRGHGGWGVGAGLTGHLFKMEKGSRVWSALARCKDASKSRILTHCEVNFGLSVLFSFFFVALFIRLKKTTRRSSAVPSAKFTSRGTRAAHRWCARTANMLSAGTVWSPWMWVGSS